MKKKIVFMLINMNIGGTEKALLNMIEEISEEEYEITILLLEKYGGFLEDIPAYVKIEYVEGYQKIKRLHNDPPKISINNFLKKRSFEWIPFSITYALSKILKRKSIFMRYLLKDIPILRIQYDIAVAYAGPMDLISYFVIHKIKANKKVQWIHFDVTKIGFNVKFTSELYNKFHKIFVVSVEGESKLLNLIPRIKNKTEVFHNVVSSNVIQRKARESKGFEDDFDGLRILTVGRLSHEKGQDLAIKAMSRLIKEGYNLKWYCIGGGAEKRNYDNLIDQNNLKDKFVLLGENKNPYPYIEQCNIYVQPSRYEGYCITVLEAKYFNKPIVATRFNGISEQINNGKTGLIVDLDEEAIYLAIKDLIKNKEKLEYFSRNLFNENNFQSSVNVIV